MFSAYFLELSNTISPENSNDLRSTLSRYLAKHLRFESCYFKQLAKILYFRRGDVVCLQALENSILSYPLPLQNLLPISNLNLIFRLNNHFKISELRFILW